MVVLGTMLMRKAVTRASTSEDRLGRGGSYVLILLYPPTFHFAGVGTGTERLRALLGFVNSGGGLPSGYLTPGSVIMTITVSCPCFWCWHG